MATLNLPLTSTFSTTAGVAFPSTPATAGYVELHTASEFRGLLGLGSLATLAAVGTSQITDASVTAAKLAQSGAAPADVFRWSGSAWVPAPVSITRYVDPSSGDDSNAGTIDAPFATIAAALAVATTSRDTIAVRGGRTISGQVVLAGQTLTSYGAGQAIFTHDGGAGGNEPTITGFGTLDNILTRNTAPSSAYAAVTLTGSDSAVRRCTMESNSNKCLTITSAFGAIIEDNLFRDSTSCAQLCTLFQSASCVVRRNTFVVTGATTASALFMHGAGTAGHVVEHNTFARTTTATTPSVYRAVYIDDDFTDTEAQTIQENWFGPNFETGVEALSSANVYRNVFDFRGGVANSKMLDLRATHSVLANTFIGDGTVLYMLSVTATGVVAWKNNLFYATSGGPFYVSSSGTVTGTDYNDYFGSTRGSPFNAGGTKTFAAWQSAFSVDANSLTVNPSLKDVATNKFWPISGTSAMEGAGVSVADQDGRLRAESVWPDAVRSAWDAAPEIGAYQAGV